MVIRIKRARVDFAGPSDATPKPTTIRDGDAYFPIPAGSTFLETDTNALKEFDGTNWIPSPEPVDIVGPSPVPEPDPEVVVVGSTYTETDTRKTFYWNGTEWILQELSRYKRFRVTIPTGSSKYYIIDQHGKLENSGTDFQVVIQAVLNAMPVSSTYEFEFDTATYTLHNPIIIPTANSSTPKQVLLKGVKGRTRTGGAYNTLLRPSTSFPNNRYAIEVNSANGSGFSPSFEMNGFYFSNIDNLAVKNIGFLKIQSDDSVSGTVNVRNIQSQYAWRCVHLLGGIWWGLFDNIVVHDSNATNVADAFFLLEHGGAGGSGNPTPKYNDFKNMRAFGTTTTSYCLRILNGNYNNFYFPTFDITPAPLVAGIALEQNASDTLIVFNNVFYNPHLLDAGTNSGPPYQAGIYLNGQYVGNNWFFACHMNRVNNHFKITNGALRNYIQSTAYWAGPVQADSTGAGVSNTLEVVNTSATAAQNAIDDPVTDIGGLLRIIDKRRGAENGGVAAARTDGSTIAHGLFATPAWYWAQPTVANEIISITAVSATTLTLAIKKRSDGLAGTSQNVAWRAGVYS